MKRVALLAVALCALAVVVPVAQTAPTQPNGCTVEHLSGAECQGPDLEPEADSCDISTWVGNATCDLTVSDGVANTSIGFISVFAALQDTNWHSELHLVIRDKGTGQVLFSRDASVTAPVSEHPQGPTVDTEAWSAPLSATGGGEAVCEVTGTHTPAGAPFSAQAVLEGFGAFNNILRCEVR
jgi:hypothetical protein